MRSGLDPASPSVSRPGGACVRDVSGTQESAASPFGIPQPISVSGCAAFEAVRLSAWMIHTGGQLGRACMRHAARPATSGAETDVPVWRE